MLKAVGSNLFAAGVAVILSLFVGLVGVLAAPPKKADKPDPGQPGTLNVRTLNIVDGAGKPVITLTSVDGAHGIWVNGQKAGTQAGIVSSSGFESPYLMVFDYRPSDAGKYPVGCQFAVTTVEGEPSVQLVGKGDAVTVYNPLREAAKPVKRAAGDDAPKPMPAKPVLFDFPKRERPAGD